jgi:hypothetical protein
MVQQFRERRLEYVDVPIVKGDAHKPTVTTRTHCVEERPDPDTAQAMPF